jgi:hypothetical protein
MRDAEIMLMESARRYALLTAFVAAEHCTPIEDLLTLEDVSSLCSHPSEVIESYNRLTNMGRAENIIYTLSDKAKKDKEIILRSSFDYEMYLFENHKVLSNGKGTGKEYHLGYARNIFFERDPEDEDYFGSSYSIKKPGYSYSPGFKRLPVNQIIHTIGEVELASLDRPDLRSPSVPFLVEYPSGIIINLDKTKSIEILNRRGSRYSPSQTHTWYRQIRRIVKDTHGKRVVVAIFDITGTDGIFPDIMRTVFKMATDFRGPLHPDAAKKQMLGLQKHKRLHNI